MRKILLSLLTVLMLAPVVSAQSGPKKNYIITAKGEKFYKGRRIIDPVKHKAALDANHEQHKHKLRALPKATAASFDCRTLGWVVAVDDQGQCLPPGTQITMATGEVKSIDIIEDGEQVLTAEGKIGVVYQSPKRMTGKIKWLNFIESRSDRLRLTDEHPVLTKRGYIAAEYIEIGDYVKKRIGLNSDTWQRVDRVGCVPYGGWLHNIAVTNGSSYVADGFGVHNCGSCWCFSGTEVVDCCYLKTWGTLSPGPFSKQYTLDCYDNGGCNGDDNTTVLIHAKSVGLPNKTAYGPYTASAGTCKTGLPLFKIQDWLSVDGSGVGDTQKIKDAMVAYGPVGCAVAAGGSDFWNTGAGTDTGTSTEIDHDVLLVGWDDTHDNGDGSKGAWIMQNSWNTSWGSMQGCAWMKYGADSIGTEPVVAIAPPPPGPIPVPPVPPGPTPPVPPVPPTPPTPNQVLGTGTLADGTPFQMVPASAGIVWGGMTIQQLRDVLDKCTTPAKAPAATPAPAPAKAPCVQADRLDKLEQQIDKLGSDLKTILEYLYTPKKMPAGPPPAKEKTSRQESVMLRGRPNTWPVHLLSADLTCNCPVCSRRRTEVDVPLEMAP